MLFRSHEVRIAQVYPCPHHHRRYLTVAIGCTGGQHRSVFLAERIAADFAARHADVSVRHSGLPGVAIFSHSTKPGPAP